MNRFAVPPDKTIANFRFAAFWTLVCSPIGTQTYPFAFSIRRPVLDLDILGGNTGAWAPQPPASSHAYPTYWQGINSHLNILPKVRTKCKYFSASFWIFLFRHRSSLCLRPGPQGLRVSIFTSSFPALPFYPPHGARQAPAAHRQALYPSPPLKPAGGSKHPPIQKPFPVYPFS